MPTSLRSRARSWRNARVIYGSHIWRLLLSGKPPRRYTDLDPNQPADMTNASDDLVTLVIEEGRRTQDANVAELEATRSKAQFAFTTALALVGLIAAELPRLHHRGVWYWTAYFAVAVLALLALGGTLAVLVNTVRVPIIHPALASHYADEEPGTALKGLAKDYALNAVDWSNINATQRVVLREASLYLTFAALVDAIVWIALHR